MFGGINHFEFKDKKITQCCLRESLNTSQKIFQDGKFWCIYDERNERFLSDNNNGLFAIVQGNIRILNNALEEGIFSLYMNYGPDFLKHLAGIFSLVLWDSKNKMAILATDIFSIKPLFYCSERDGLLFSSSIKPIINCIQPALNSRAVYMFIVFGFIPGDQTIVENIKKIEGSMYIAYKPQNFELKGYYDICIKPEKKEFSYYTKKINLEFVEMIKEYSMNLDKVAVLFSGGLDSTLILSILSRLGKKVVTFSGVLEGDGENEGEYIKEISDTYSSKSIQVRINKETIIKSFPKSVRLMEQPVFDLDAPLLFAGIGSIPSEYALFGGKGADELYCSSPGYTPQQKEKNAVMGMPRKWLRNNDFLFAYPYFISSMKIEKNSSRSIKLLKENLRFFSCFKYNDYALNKQFFDLKYFMGHEMSIADSVFAYKHINYYYPFLDKEFVDLSLKIPLEYKMKSSIDKYILRRSFSNMLPRKVLNAPKRNTTVPSGWIIDNIDYSRILTNSKFLRKYFNRQYLDVNNINKYAPKEILKLLILHLWHENFLAVGGKEDE